jgi:hypothetical protein
VTGVGGIVGSRGVGGGIGVGAFVTPVHTGHDEHASMNPVRSHVEPHTRAQPSATFTQSQSCATVAGPASTHAV